MKREQLLKHYESVGKEEQIPCESTILHGKNGIAEAIFVRANNDSYDTLVIGSRRLNSEQKMVLGGVSHKVMKYVNTPVLMIGSVKAPCCYWIACGSSACRGESPQLSLSCVREDLPAFFFRRRLTLALVFTLVPS
ncbi:universal stress protein [Alkalicoccus halolimnae]|uniref:Universal stress protein n=1 Tax=Alkalicoccus halolimnae TaxID=1667239 RepID=A0AAJ8LR13_9BACI